MNEKGDIIPDDAGYTEDNQIEVKLNNETVWLTQDQMAELFDRGKVKINEPY